MSFRPQCDPPPEPNARPTLTDLKWLVKDQVLIEIDQYRKAVYQLYEYKRTRCSQTCWPQTKLWLDETAAFLSILRYDLVCLFEERPSGWEDQLCEKMHACVERLEPICAELIRCVHQPTRGR